MNRVKNIVIWVLILGYMFVVPGFVANERIAVKCDHILINIKDSLSKQFVTEADVLSLINRVNYSMTGSLAENIQLDEIEDRLMEHPAVKTAEAYCTVVGEIIVDIEQRRPIVRIIDGGNTNYYIDEEGFFIPSVRNFSEHVLVINGHINTDLAGKGAVQHLDNSRDSELLKGLFEMAVFMHQDELWSSQIVQVYVRANRELELIPRVGAHVIVLGKVDNYREKLFKLETVYKDGLSNLGWNQYREIDLRYNNQVICTKK